MDFQRNQLPQNISVDCSIKITREELIEILNFWVKSKVNSRVVLENIEIGGSAEVVEQTNAPDFQNFQLEYLIVSGKENIALSWKKP